MNLYKHINTNIPSLEMGFIMSMISFLPFSALLPGGGVWTQALKLEMIRQVFYRCATAPGHVNDKLNQGILRGEVSLYHWPPFLTGLD